MNQRLAMLNRLQQARGFKIAASILVVALALTAIFSYVIVVSGPAKQALQDQFAGEEAAFAEYEVQLREQRDILQQQPDGPSQAEAFEQAELDLSAERSLLEQQQRVLQSIVSARQSPMGFAVGVFVLMALHLVVIWLSLGLTYLALYTIAAAIAGPLMLMEQTASFGYLLIGVVILTAAFAALLQGLRLALSAPHPVFAIARNVMAEAVRMKISLLFIVLVIFGLAALPGLLDPNEELRYRVQSFLQYATGGTYALVAMLTVFFSVATVTFEQREKVIWQTVTKPVSAMQYIFGKWLGVVVLNAAILGVCASGIFLFTEYLRNQPAIGESSAYALDVTGDSVISEDRRLLETRVLTARVLIDAEPSIEPDDPAFIESASEYIEQIRVQDPEFGRTEAAVSEALTSLYTDVQRRYRTIFPGGDQVYVFTGLEEAKKRGSLLGLRFNVDAGGNDPSKTVRLTFQAANQPPQIRESILGFPQTLTIGPWAIDDDGVLGIRIINGDIERGVANDIPISFPEKDGLILDYAVGGFRMNFMKVAFVLWCKLAFLAMVGVFAGTFLSFPVASLITIFILIAAESAGYLISSLQGWGIRSREGELQLWRAAVSLIATQVGRAFQIYAELKPTTRLVEGVYLPWYSVAGGLAFIGGWITVLYFAAVYAFRRRELAIYSGN